MKRLFDIVFSSLVILLILSWLTPLLYILIKLESKGPLFFKQSRHGYNKKTFFCYKFRSMTVNCDADKVMNTKNDMRVTRIGKFMRKTSLDELPQFFNVFLGNMSVVGPRPHMEVHTSEYGASVDKYLVRHFAKPGVTGLAQIKGYRGEIIQPSDMVNRVRMDIFYLEKWSPLLDFKIVYATVVNAVVGEEKAY
jgi:putative colanic acid biosynthesis UDP-glucose lipid carrier transferase